MCVAAENKSEGATGPPLSRRASALARSARRVGPDVCLPAAAPGRNETWPHGMGALGVLRLLLALLLLSPLLLPPVQAPSESKWWEAG